MFGVNPIEARILGLNLETLRQIKSKILSNTTFKLYKKTLIKLINVR
jgi:hypothetical protein